MTPSATGSGPRPPIPLPIRLQQSSPPTQADLNAREARWCEWKWEINASGHSRDVRPYWRNKSIPTSDQITELLETEYIRKGLLTLPAGYKVRKFAGGFYNFLYLITTNPHVPDDPGPSIGSDGRDYQNKEVSQITYPGFRLPGVAGDMLLRIKVPWAPWYGVENEVANMVWAAQKGIPVPKIHYFDSSAQNSLQLEFTILERIPNAISAEEYIYPDGRRDTHHTHIQATIKPVLTATRQILQSLWSDTLPAIGSLYINWDHDHVPPSPLFRIGPLIDIDLFGPLLPSPPPPYDHLLFPRPNPIHPTLPNGRGPFHTTAAYLLARLHARLLRNWSLCTTRLAGLDWAPPTPSETALLTWSPATSFYPALQAYHRLHAHISHHLTSAAHPYFYTNPLGTPKLVHIDLHTGNILVDPDNFPPDEGEITAAIDWESAHVLPAALQVVIPKVAVGDGFHVDQWGLRDCRLNVRGRMAVFPEWFGEGEEELRRLRWKVERFVTWLVPGRVEGGGTGRGRGRGRRKRERERDEYGNWHWDGDWDRKGGQEW